MRMNKKKLAVVSLVLCIAAIVSMGSLAWFTADDTINNTLKFTNEADFIVDVIEHDPVTGAEVGTLDNTTGNTYENLLPNQLIAKDPYVINKSASEAQFIRVTVTLSKADKWKALITDGTDLSTIFEGFDGTKWTRYDNPVDDDTAKTISYTFYLNDKLPAKEYANLFTGVRIPAAVEMKNVADLQGTTITIKAEARQTTGFKSDATAYTAFTTPDAVKDVTAA